MTSESNRRKFLGTAAGVAAFTIVPRHALGGPGYVPPSDKVTLAYIGTGTQGLREMLTLLPAPEIQIVAVCDPNRDAAGYRDFGKDSLLRTIRQTLNKSDWRAGSEGLQELSRLGRGELLQHPDTAQSTLHFGRRR